MKSIVYSLWLDLSDWNFLAPSTTSLHEVIVEKTSIGIRGLDCSFIVPDKGSVTPSLDLKNAGVGTAYDSQSQALCYPQTAGR